MDNTDETMEQLTEKESRDIDILNTIYDKVIKVGNERYALNIGICHGLVDKLQDISVDSIYKHAIYRDKYAVFYDSDKASNKIIFFNTKEEVLLSSLGNSNANDRLTEHYEFGFGLVEVATQDNPNRVTIFETSTGKKLLDYDNKETVSRRPFNNYIILAVSNETDEIIGINTAYEADTVMKLLLKEYKTVEIKKGKQGGYLCINKAGDTVELNKFGQIY